MATHFTRALRTIALVEASKGIIVLAAGLGLLAMVHDDFQRMAEALVAHFHLNPASHYPRIFLDLASQVTEGRILLLAGGAALYSIGRFVEAYGLWHVRGWAEWFAALTAGIYIPFELYELYRHVNWLSIGSLALNVFIVGFMLYGVFRRDREAHGTA
jgi:uncharacterized membrane protein (DUF2068 family)